MKEQKNYEIIKKLVDTKGNKNKAALKLDCTTRHINRLIKGYESEGKAFFLHGNRGRKPQHACSESTKSDILDLYRTKYYDANFKHYTELLAKHEKIIVSDSTVRSVLMKNNILSPRATRAVKKRTRIQLEAKKKATVSKKELKKIEENRVFILVEYYKIIQAVQFSIEMVFAFRVI